MNSQIEKSYLANQIKEVFQNSIEFEEMEVYEELVEVIDQILFEISNFRRNEDPADRMIINRDIIREIYKKMKTDDDSSKLTKWKKENNIRFIRIKENG